MEHDTHPNPIAASIGDALPVNKEGEIDPFSPPDTNGYGVRNGCMIRLQPKRRIDPDNPEKTHDEIYLCNFVARIARRIDFNDGENSKAGFEIEGRLSDGTPLPTLQLTHAQFSGMNWPLQFWPHAIVSAGQTVRDNLRCSIQWLSGRPPLVIIYTSTGWYKLATGWAFLSASGAIGTDGLDETISAELDLGNMQRYLIPAPHPRIHQAAGRLLSLLHVSNNRALGVALLCAIARAPLRECAPIDFSIFLAGRTGSGKTECAAVALGCFGRFDRDYLTASFMDSSADLEAKLFQANGVIAVVDEFKPAANQYEQNKLHAKADRLFMGVGNNSGGGRRNPDMTRKADYHPRGLVIATGEDLPRGASTKARMLIIRVTKEEMCWQTLGSLQHAREQGDNASVVSAYLQWLAPQIPELKCELPKRIIAIRDEANAAGFAESHSRASGIYASLLVGLEVFLRFLHEVGALSERDASSLLDDVKEDLNNLTRAQGDFQREADEVERFRELLRACFASGEAHVCNPLDQGQPAHLPYLWGWRKVDTIKDFDGDGGLLRERDIYAANGAGIGYLANHTGKNRETRAELWLEPQATFKAVQRFATQQGEPFLTSQATLWRRLQERNHLLECEFDTATGTHRPTAKRSTGGSRKRLLILSPGFVVEKDHPTGWDGEPQP